VDNSGTGTGIAITQNGAGKGFTITQAGDENAMSISKTTTGGGSTAVIATTTGSNIGLYVPHSGTGTCLRVDRTSSTASTAVLEINGSSTNATGYCLLINNSSTADSIRDDSGAKLTAAGVWTNAPCWIQNKVDVEPVDIAQILDSFKRLSISRYNTQRMKDRGCEEKHYGFFLDELSTLFNLSENSPGEQIVITAAAVKALLARVEELEKQVASLLNKG
jgi:hypothetical protein